MPGAGGGHVDPGLRVARELDAVVRRRGHPQMIVSDNGTELTSNAVLTWADDMPIGWHDIVPGKPQQSGVNESLGWLTPRAFADALRGHAPGVLRSLEAPHPELLPPPNQGPDQRRTLATAG